MTVVLSGSPARAVDNDFCAFTNIFGAGPPPYYVAYKVDTPPVIDGALDDPAWAEVGFTDSNPGEGGDGTLCGARDTANPHTTTL